MKSNRLIFVFGGSLPLSLLAVYFFAGLLSPLLGGEFAVARPSVLFSGEDPDWTQSGEISLVNGECSSSKTAWDGFCDEDGGQDWLAELCTRPTLTNGLFGLQAPLAEDGIGYQAFLTQFYQGTAGGGQEQVFRYGGKVDQFFSLDSGKLGLWNGTIMALHAETRYGQDANVDAVGLAPVNANMLYPGPEAETSITALNFTQALSEEWIVSTGTFNLLDLFAQLYPQTGRGIDGFMNMSAITPLSVGRPLNLSVLGASVGKLHDGQVEGSLAVFNTANATTNSTFNSLFENGAVIMGFYRLFTDFGDLPGSHALLGIYSSGSYTSVDPSTWYFLPGTGIIAGQETGTWNLTYFYEQKLWVDPCDENRNVGLLTSWGISDGNPNPISWAGNVAIQGQGLIEGRPQDTYGFSYFHTALSGEFERLVSPLVTVGDINGVELYYNAAITPWFHLTPDFQVITPADRSLDTAIVIGLRGKISL